MVDMALLCVLSNAADYFKTFFVFFQLSMGLRVLVMSLVAGLPKR